MSRYVIEVRPDCKVVQQICESDGKVYVGSTGVHYLEELNSDYINEHYGSLQDEAYQKGLQDGKEYREKGCEGCKWEDKEYNICTTCRNSYKNLYERKDADDEIKVGDEVRLCRHKVPYIVTSCNGDDGTYILMTVNGGFIKAEKCNVRKIGRHFDIEKILGAMKE